MVSPRSEEEGNKLRDRIFGVLRNSRTSAEEDLTALLHCAAHIANRTIVEQTAKECGLRPCNLQANNDLELYFDLKDGRQDVGYISKGWEDPGFRVGDLVSVPRSRIGKLRANSYRLLKFCATRGVTLTMEEKEVSIVLHMDSVIYSDGFNKSVLTQVVHYLRICVEKAEELMA